jgi:hypothetical protein
VCGSGAGGLGSRRFGHRGLMVRSASTGCDSETACSRVSPVRQLRRALEWLRIENEVLHEASAPLIHQAPVRVDRAWFAVLSALVSRVRWFEVFPVTPRTLLTWHRRLVAGKRTPSRRAPGRPWTRSSVKALILWMAGESPRWGGRCWCSSSTAHVASTLPGSRRTWMERGPRSRPGTRPWRWENGLTRCVSRSGTAADSSPRPSTTVFEDRGLRILRSPPQAQWANAWSARYGAKYSTTDPERGTPARRPGSIRGIRGAPQRRPPAPGHRAARSGRRSRPSDRKGHRPADRASPSKTRPRRPYQRISGSCIDLPGDPRPEAGILFSSTTARSLRTGCPANAIDVMEASRSQARRRRRHQPTGSDRHDGPRWTAVVRLGPRRRTSRRW